MGLLDDIDRRREASLNDRENSARLAQAYCVFVTTGQGSIQYEERVDFGLTFIEQPVVAYGSYFDLDELANELDVEDTDTVPLPSLTGLVLEWDQDDRGFYVGCWVGARVYFAPDAGVGMAVVPAEATPEIKHHFTFSAIAMKDIPPSVEDPI